MKNTLPYKGFIATIEYDFSLKSVAIAIPNVNTGTARPFKIFSTIAEAEEEFHAVIDDYLDVIKTRGSVSRNIHAKVTTIRVSKEQWERIVDATTKTGHGISLYDEMEKIVKANT
jgi:predicted HicB family RNase H-like nuclease